MTDTTNDSSDRLRVVVDGSKLLEGSVSPITIEGKVRILIENIKLTELAKSIVY
ncbi:MAG: hypothetical protein GY845_38460 [Planctomycetes bacterium]|nr:hypothetical protein [Planctomycetota bacterium]